MPRIEPSLLPVVIDLERGLRELGVPFGMVGALVPELLLDAKPRHVTNDADVTVVVQTLDDYEELKERLGRFGFERTRLRHRMRHRTGGLLDILPYSDRLVPQGRLVPGFSKLPADVHRWTRGHAIMTDRPASAVVVEAL